MIPLAKVRRFDEPVTLKCLRQYFCQYYNKIVIYCKTFLIQAQNGPQRDSESQIDAIMFKNIGCHTMNFLFSSLFNLN